MIDPKPERPDTWELLIGRPEGRRSTAYLVPVLRLAFFVNDPVESGPGCLPDLVGYASFLAKLRSADDDPEARIPLPPMGLVRIHYP